MKRIIFCLGISGWLIAGANARDLGQWETADSEIRQWYQALMQPDIPNASCCGEADAYWADEVHVRDGKTYVIIGRTNNCAGPMSISARKLKFPSTNSNGTAAIQPATASFS
jgi:hypothetical protein